jgi:hypothetical protein
VHFAYRNHGLYMMCRALKDRHAWVWCLCRDEKC